MSEPKIKKPNLSFLVNKISAYGIVNWAIFSFIAVCVLGIAGMAIAFAVLHTDWIILGIAIFMALVDVSVSLALIWTYFDMQRGNLRSLKKYYERQRGKEN